MSTLKFNKWQNITGTTMSAVLQVQSAQLTTTFSTTTLISSGGAAVTGLSVTLSPYYSTSKILVFGHMVSGSTSGYTQAFYKLKRNGSEIGNGTAVSNRPGVIARSYYADGNVCQTDAYFYLDSPGTTASLTYQIYLGTESTSYTSYINRTQNDSDNTGNGSRGASSITVMEIAQ